MRNRAGPDGEPQVSSNDDAEEMTLSGEPVAGRYKKGGELSDAEFLAVHGKTRAQIAEEKRFVESQGMEINYLVPPRSTKLLDVIAVFIAHMLPFTLAPFILTIIVVYISYMLLGWLGPLISFLVLFYLTVCRMHYDPKTRRMYQELYLKMARYMVSVRMVTPRDPIPDGPYIFAFHPHGRMFYSTSLIIQSHDLWRKHFCPKGDFFGSAAGAFFVVPIVRNILNNLGVVSVDKPAIVRTLRNKNHVTITIGGVKEICLGTNPDYDTLYLMKRKGFIKVAMDEKAGIVPIYNFNENQIFRPEPHWFLAFWEWVNNYIGLGVPGMRGYLQMPMPFRKELLFVVGKPLFAKEGETVDEFHARYVEALKQLFDTFVTISPHPSHKLVIT
ncbi:unnamed protein product [Closterium sp. Yama58-4]|nr:unnamed protein product [Closterium sp. Yama58-4]